MTEQDRPEWIQVGQWKVNLKHHDEWFQDRYKKLRQNILDCHPDRRHMTLRGLSRSSYRIVDLKCIVYTNATGAFRVAKEDMDIFLRSEIKWYAANGGFSMPLKGSGDRATKRVGRNHLGLLT